MTAKERYKIFCDEHPAIPLFMQYWWMEAVCINKEWDVLLSCNENGDIVAAMPYLWGKKLGMKYIMHPQQTQTNGCWIRPSASEDLEQVRAITYDFIQQIESLKLAYYYQQYPINSMVPLLLKERGFKVKERVTYRIDNLTDIDKIIASFSKNKKRQLQKALASHVDLNLSADEFYRFHTHCLQEQKKQISYSYEFFLSFYTRAKQRNQAQLLAIKNADGYTQAALCLVWDTHSAYFLIPCYSAKHKESGASSLLVLEAIKFARGKVQEFDFEGSMIRGVANHYKQFGSTKTKYYSVEKRDSFLFSVLLCIYKLTTWKKR